MEVVVESVPRKPPPPHRAAWLALLAGLAVCGWVVVRLIAPFLGVLVLAVVAAGLLAPVYQWTVVAVGGRRHVAALMICVLLLVALLVPLFITAQAVTQEALGFYELSTTQLTEHGVRGAIEQRQQLLDRVNRLLAPLRLEVTVDDVYEQVTTLGFKLGAFFYSSAVSMAGHLLRFVLGFVFWVLVVYYLLLDGGRLREWFLRTVPLPRDQQDLVIHRFMDMASSIVLGNGVAGLIQGVAGGLLFYALGLPGPVLWGVVMAILAFIPVIGISLVYIPAALLLALAGDTGRALAVLIPLAALATVVEYWLKPLMVGRRSQVHTLLVFLSMIGGIDAFGAVGLLLGPLMMTAFLTLVSIFQERYRPHVRSLTSAEVRHDPTPDAVTE